MRELLNAISSAEQPLTEGWTTIAAANATTNEKNFNAGILDVVKEQITEYVMNTNEPIDITEISDAFVNVNFSGDVSEINEPVEASLVIETSFGETRQQLRNMPKEEWGQDAIDKIKAKVERLIRRYYPEQAEFIDLWAVEIL